MNGSFPTLTQRVNGSAWSDDFGRSAMTESTHRFQLDFPEMDVQHDYLYNLFDHVGDLPPVNKTAAAKALLTELEHYIMFHFSCEEHLMRMYVFPNFTVHKSDHERVEARLSEFLDDFDLGNFNPSALRKFLSNWLWEHSSISDVEYVAWIKEKRADLTGSGKR
jgi:hemerythrin